MSCTLFAFRSFLRYFFYIWYYRERSKSGYSVNKEHKATTSLRISCLFCIFKHFVRKYSLTTKTGVIKNKNTW